jgi:hypothetical protein
MNCWIQRSVSRLSWSLLLGAIALVAATGCGGFKKYGADVTGTVTIDGELARSGTVTFHPTDKAGKIAVGRIYPDGSFSLRTGQGDLGESDGGTVVPGEYIVTVVVSGPSPAPTTPGGPPPAGPLLIAERYIDRDTTDLRKTIVAGENVLAFELERAASDAKSQEAEHPETNSAEVATPVNGAPAPNTDTDSAPVEGAQP